MREMIFGAQVHKEKARALHMLQGACALLNKKFVHLYRAQAPKPYNGSFKEGCSVYHLSSK